ncbi:hypothetical protein [Nocardia callitridis]|uniref:MFS transporter n=1 Tax=Nocardia callitridis TaxID=648753 RepID=A0ABP9L5N4_9NOCA
MSTEADRAAASRGDALARVRGGSVGMLSGAVSVAAHGWASNGMAPDSTTLILLAAACALIGALVAGLAPLRDTGSGLVTALFAGQLLGHVSMGLGAGHSGHAGLRLSPTMLMAHVLATAFAALVVLGVEAAYRAGTATLTRTLRLRLPAPDVPDRAPLRTVHHDRVILRVLAAQLLRTRGPPAVALR